MPDNNILEIQDLSFTYPEQERRAVDGLTLSVERGEFLVLCGPSGCGKSTLLLQLKTVLRPHGVREGRILVDGEDLDSLDLRAQSERIGFVRQSPESQIVTDKVWHELAFGLESLGRDTPSIRRRVAEMASFFGIQTWFYKNVTELSGGQKQLLNLASVMVMQPQILILDEPTSQLDPIAASDFLAAVGRVNRELGTTVILTEHRLEEAFPLAHRVAVMDGGRLVCAGAPAEVGRELLNAGQGMSLAMPAPMRIWAATGAEGDCPVTVNEGRNWLERYCERHPPLPLPAERTYPYPEEAAIEAQGVWFKYDKDGPDVVKGLDLRVRRGEFLALLGGNGTGKTTTLKLLAGLETPYRGDIVTRGAVGVLPQDPQTLFVKKTVREDLEEIFQGRRTDGSVQMERLAQIVTLCRLEELLDRHPYDLSGGEQQRAALAKVLLLRPEILLMDEPTKGLDAEFKLVFARILRDLLAAGVTVLMASHDVEFCARHAHRCALFFDGNIVAQDTPRRFFSGNSFYTTSASRMCRAVLPEAVTAEDVIRACGGTLPREEPTDGTGYTLPEKQSERAAVKTLPRWRKITAIVSALVALGAFLKALSVTDLSALVTGGGLTEAAAPSLAVYGVLIAALAALAASIGRRSKPPAAALQSPAAKGKLSKRTAAAAVMILLCIPVTLFVGRFYLGDRKYYFISLLVLLECMLPFFLVFEGRRPQARELVITAVLCALGVAGRVAFFMLPQFKPVMAITIIAGVAFGGETGFLVGSLTMLASNMFFSQGPLTPWQMFAMGIIGFLAGVLFRRGLLRRNREALAVFGAITAIVVYGGIMNPASALTWSATVNWGVILTYYFTGFPMDCVQAAATALALFFAAEPMLEKLDRIKVKYGLVE